MTQQVNAERFQCPVNLNIRYAKRESPIIELADSYLFLADDEHSDTTRTTTFNHLAEVRAKFTTYDYSGYEFANVGALEPFTHLKYLSHLFRRASD